jgi:histidinol phosphatase-like PHP family hydrolase
MLPRNTVKIENTEFVRDMNSKAVINTDANGLARYKEIRKKTIMAKQDNADTKRRLAQVEKDMAALRTLVGELLRSSG